MAIVAFRRYRMEIEDKRDAKENVVRDKIILKTSERYTWSRLRRERPVPQWNDEHSSEPGFYLDFVKPFHRSRLVWELEAEFVPIKGGQIDANPLARPAEITFDGSLVEQLTFEDKDGRTMTTTAGEPLLDIAKQIPLVEYSIKKNFGSDPPWIQTHLGAVNSDTIRLRGLDWKPRTLLLARVSGGPIVTENRVTYSEYGLTILADPRTWSVEVWNRGTVELVFVPDVNPVTLLPTGGPGVWRQVAIMETDKDGAQKPVSAPVFLDRAGRRIEGHLSSDSGTPVDSSKLVRLRFNVQNEKPFSALRAFV